jgi:hypothetical protein
MKLDYPICQIRLSGLSCFEQELLDLIHFVYEHIFVTLLGNRLLQARQT